MKTIDLASSPVSNQQAGTHRVEIPVTLARAGLMAGLLCVLGTFSVYSSDFALWQMWVDVPLKSVGASRAYPDQGPRITLTARAITHPHLL